MKIFTAEQIRNCDLYTIKNEPVASIQLMERAAQSCVDWISENCNNHRNFAVFCGNGNNGGDGFAIAKMLYLKGFDVDVFTNPRTGFSVDAQSNFKSLKEISGISIRDLKEAENYRFDGRTVIIDALLGTGLSRDLQGELKELVELLNLQNNIKISVDMPSGLYADKISPHHPTIFRADHTLSFQFWKRTFLHPETGKYAGKVHILDIRLSEDYISETPTDEFVIHNMVKDIFRPRNEFSHKGTYGKATIIGGSYGKMGAAVLATRAALKTGAGLTFTLAPKCGYEILQTVNPEAMFIEGGTDFIETFEAGENSALGIGPGLGTHEKTAEKFLEFLKEYAKPLILDADALNIISQDPKNIALIPEKSVITPHPKEFERLFGETENSFVRLDLAKQKAKELDIYIVLKDHHTQVITPQGQVFYNITGNSGLAKGGSGDILTGILTSFLAQNYPEKEAAILGVWFHGKAAQYACEKYSKEAMLPTDVIQSFGNVFEELERKVARML